MAGEAPAVAAPAAPVATAPAAAPNGAAKAPEEAWDFQENGKTVKLTRAEAQKRFAEASYHKQRLQQAADDAKSARAERAKLETERLEEQKLAKENKAEFLKKYGIDEKVHAREVLERELKEQSMNEDQRRAAQLEKENAALKKTEEQRAAEAQKAQIDAQSKNITQWMVTGLDRAAKAAGLQIGPKEFHVIYGVAAEFGEAGLPLDAEWHNRVIAEAKERIDGSYTRLEAAVAAGLTGKALADRLGERVVDEIMKYRLELVRGKRQFGGAKPTGEPTPAAPKPSKYLSMREAEEQLRKASRL